MGTAPAMQCPKCGHSNPTGTLRCPACEALTAFDANATATGIGFTEGFSRAVPLNSEATQSPVAPGTLIAGRYEILQMLGQGGMGAVYKARDTELDRLVALKVIRPELAGDPKTLQRFKQELILSRQITDRNVVRIFDLGTHDNIKFITMEFVEGRDLSSMLDAGHKFPATEAARIIRQVSRALEAAHAENVIHRDLKPQNVMIDSAGKVLVMDFGLARSVELSGLTQTGAVLGTPAYMSPEQAKGMPLDHRSDLFSLGVMFYELLTGEQPYKADTVWGMLIKRVQEPAPSVSSVAPDVPEALSQIVAKCLAIDPAQRYQSAVEVSFQLDLWLDDSPLSKHLSQQRMLTGQTAAVPPIEPTAPAPKTSNRKWIVAGACAAVLLLLAGVFGWRAYRPNTPTPTKTETVVVADIINGTGDTIFDGTLEPVLRLALEGAGFISAYNRTNLPARLESPAAKFDEPAALRMAVSQGLGVVISGSLERSGSGYKVSARVVRPVTGAILTNASATAKDKTEVLAAVGKLAGDIRKALGDDSSESARRFATDTLTATSLEAVHEYASAMEFLSSGRFDEARLHFTKATDLDPKFGLAWAGMASASRSLGEDQQAEKYIKAAYANIDSMTERERYRTRALYFVLTGDQQKCVEEYSSLIARYASDVGAHNNLGICYTLLRNIPKATQEMQKAVEILPKRAVYRFNLALYRAYAGEFKEAENEVRNAQELNPKYEKGYLTQAYAQLGLGRVADAAKSYQNLGTLSPRASSLAATALGDLAIYEGRFREAIDILQAGAREDLAAKRPDAAADKFLALGYAQLAADHKTAAIAALNEALAGSTTVKTRFVAGRLLAEAGDIAKTRALAAGLASESKPEPQSYAKLLEAAALRSENPAQAVSLATQAVGTFDTWIARYELGRAFLAAGEFPQADSEFDRCIKRRGEAMELFMDDAATYGYFPSVYYQLGRVREGMKGSGQESYGKYLEIRGKAGEDPLLPEVRRKLGK
jgi:tetratricopeptide (TPR) repeat protein